MAVEDLLLYFIVIPAAAYGLGAVWVRRTMRMIAEHELGFLRQPGVNSKFLVVVQLFATPVVFGLIVLFQLLSLPEDDVHASVVRSLGWTFAAAASLTIAAEASIFVRWRASAFRENFGPALVLAVIPETTVVYVLIVALLIIGKLRAPLIQGGADVLVRAAQWMLLGSASAPLGAFLANRLSVLSRATFGKALAWTAASQPLAIVCLVLALLAIGTV